MKDLNYCILELSTASASIELRQNFNTPPTATQATAIMPSVHYGKVLLCLIVQTLQHPN